MKKLIILSLLATSLISYATPQMRGIIFDDVTRKPLVGVRIETLDTTVITDDKGTFKLKLKKSNQIILINTIKYKTVKFDLSDMKYDFTIAIPLEKQ